jgi:hypothetical protein
MLDQLKAFFRPEFPAIALKAFSDEIESTIGKKGRISSVRWDAMKVMVRVETINGKEEFLFRV